MKPRARYSHHGYWTVRTTRWDGYVVQGVGLSLELAYADWVHVQEYVRYLT